MKPSHQNRRGLLITGAAGITTLGGGAIAAFAKGRRDEMAYDDAVRITWRHSHDFNIPKSAAQVELVRYATLAANSHNSQPWRFSLEDHAILIRPDLTRHLNAVDSDNHHLYASLGCAALNMAEAASAFGLKATAHFDPVISGIRVDLQPGPSARSELFNAIPRRQSTRVPYDERLVSAKHLGLLEAAGNSPGMHMFLFTEANAREEILAYLIAGNDAQIDDAAFMSELKSWLRFNDGDAVLARDGLFSKCTGNPVMPGWIGRMALEKVFTKTSEARKYRTQIRSSSGIAVFVSDSNDPQGWAASGQCAQRFALQAAALGIHHAYINQPVEVPSVRGQFATWLGIGTRRPDLVMRFGYGADMPRSLRRPVGQVIERV